MTLQRTLNCGGQSAPRNTCIITDERIFPSLPQLITAAGLRILTDFSMASAESPSMITQLLFPYAVRVTWKLLPWTGLKVHSWKKQDVVYVPQNPVHISVTIICLL